MDSVVAKKKLYVTTYTNNLIWSLSQPSITLIVSPRPPRQCQPVHTVCEQQKVSQAQTSMVITKTVVLKLDLVSPDGDKQTK